MIHIQSFQDVERVRNQLIEFLWLDEGLPISTEGIEVVEADPWVSGYANVGRHEILTIKMELGFASVINFYRPLEKDINRLILFHQGHQQFIVGSATTINFFLLRGFSVLTFEMPLIGANKKPEHIEGRLTHFNFFELKTENFEPIKIFIEPVIRAINYVEDNHSYEDISMIGISGGGWTTTVCAAIDPRIKLSFPVAGSYPAFLRQEPNRPGTNEPFDAVDWEQKYPDFYYIANYLDLYILGSDGEGRKQLQVLNQYDPVFCAGIRYLTYESVVSNRVRELGNGEFAVFLDKSGKYHRITLHTLEVAIIKEF